MNLFRTREGAIADDDVKTQLTTMGSQTTPGALLVPGSATHLKAIHVAAVASNEGAAQSAYMVRLEGPGIERGMFNCAAGADGGAVVTGGIALTKAQRIPVNIKVTPGQEILIFGEALGADQGTYQMGVTLEFGSEAGKEGEIVGEVTVEGDITSVDTLTRLTTQGSVNAPSRLTPPDATLLKRIVYAVAFDAAADGEVSFHLRVSGDAVKGGEQVITLGAGSFIDVQSGSDSGRGVMSAVVLDDLDIEISPNETLDLSLEMAGVDIGTATGVITAIFA